MVIYMEDYIRHNPEFLYETISESIERGMRVVINFREVEDVPMEYLKESVGRVLEENSFEALKNKLNFVNVKGELIDKIEKLAEKNNSKAEDLF